MLQVTIIGHIGADARVEEANGKKFVSFNVAHTDVWVDQNNVRHESTQWISCALNGDGGKIFPFLRKGQCVMVQGRGSSRVYSSPKLRAMVSGINCAVDRIELIGSAPEIVPRELVTSDGCIVKVEKYFQLNRDDQKNARLLLSQEHILTDKQGHQFQVVKDGWVVQKALTDDEAKSANVASEQADDQA